VSAALTDKGKTMLLSGAKSPIETVSPAVRRRVECALALQRFESERCIVCGTQKGGLSRLCIQHYEAHARGRGPVMYGDQVAATATLLVPEVEVDIWHMPWRIVFSVPHDEERYIVVGGAEPSGRTPQRFVQPRDLDFEWSGDNTLRAYHPGVSALMTEVYFASEAHFQQLLAILFHLVGFLKGES
jgi:hypothetical protein